MMYVNGQFVEDHNASISVLDLGLLRGYGVFDYLRTYKRRPFHLHAHLQRLSYSAAQVGLSLPHSYEEIEAMIAHLINNSDHPELSIKILLTGGVSPDYITPEGPSHLIIHVYPYKPLPQEEYKRGITTTTTSLSRCIPVAKTLQYTPAIIALQKGRSMDAKEALYLNAKNEILEATTSNFFGFSKTGTLFTCDSEEILFGITREVIMQLAKDHFPIEKRPVSLAQLSDIAECFITSSNKEVLPVVKIDDQVIGSGEVGPHTKRLMQLFAAYTERKEWPQLPIERYIL